MVRRFLVTAVASLLAHLTYAQSESSRSFMIGPTVGLNKSSYVNDPIYSGLPTVNAPVGVFGGVDASYQSNHWLFGAKLLYQKQTYQATYPPFEYDPRNTPNPTITYRSDTDYHLLYIPLSVGYRLTPATRLQWFLGGTVEFDYSAETGRQTLFTTNGVTTITDKSASPALDLGYGAQTTLRYAVTPQIALQVEPAILYNSKDGYLIRYRDAYQFRAAFSVLVKL